MKFNYNYLIIPLLVLTSCSNELITVEQETDILVVEAFLEPTHEVSINLSKMFTYDVNVDSSTNSIDEALVYITHNGSEFLLGQVEEEPGKYVSVDPALVIKAGEAYELNVYYNDYTVSSITKIPEKPSNSQLSTSTIKVESNDRGPQSLSEPMVVSWDNEDNKYHLVVLEYLDSTYNPINSFLNPDNYDDFQKVSTEPILGGSLNLDTRQHLVFFGSYRVIIYKVNEEYANLYENISQSTLNLTEPLSNINNGLGIFTGVNSDTLFLAVEPI